MSGKEESFYDSNGSNVSEKYTDVGPDRTRGPHEEKKQRITRYTAAPTKYDNSKYGTLCVVMKNDEGTEKDYYIQISPLEGDPVWVLAQDLLFDIFKKRLLEPEFIEEILLEHQKCASGNKDAATDSPADTQCPPRDEDVHR